MPRRISTPAAAPVNRLDDGASTSSSSSASSSPILPPRRQRRVVVLAKDDDSSSTSSSSSSKSSVGGGGATATRTAIAKPPPKPFMTKPVSNTAPPRPPPRAAIRPPITTTTTTTKTTTTINTEHHHHHHKEQEYCQPHLTSTRSYPLYRLEPASTNSDNNTLQPPVLWALSLPASSLRRKLHHASSLRYNTASNDVELNFPSTTHEEERQVKFKIHQTVEPVKRMLLMVPNEDFDTGKSAAADHATLLTPIDAVGHMMPSFDSRDKDKEKLVRDKFTAMPKRAQAKAVDADKLNNAKIRLSWSQVRQLHERGQWIESEGMPVLGSGIQDREGMTFGDRVYAPYRNLSMHATSKVAANPHFWDEIVPSIKSNSTLSGDYILTHAALRAIKDIDVAVAEVLARREIISWTKLKQFIINPPSTRGGGGSGNGTEHEKELLDHALRYSHIVCNHFVVNSDDLLYNRNMNKTDRRTKIEEREKAKMKRGTSGGSSSNTTSSDVEKVTASSQYPLRRHEMFALARDLVLATLALTQGPITRSFLIPDGFRNCIPYDVVLEALEAVAVLDPDREVWALKYDYREKEQLSDIFPDVHESQLQYWKQRRAQVLFDLDQHRVQSGVAVASSGGHTIAAASATVGGGGGKKRVTWGNVVVAAAAGGSSAAGDATDGAMGSLTDKADKIFQCGMKKFVGAGSVVMTDMVNTVQSLTRDETVEVLRRVYATKGVSKDKVDLAKTKLQQHIMQETHAMRAAIVEFAAKNVAKHEAKKKAKIEKTSVVVKG